MDGKMTTFTTEDREQYEGGIPIPFAGWVSVDKEDREQMLRDQLRIQQQEIDRLNAELMAARKNNE
jgi:hemolysin-activating ACP:hemolysin acyltransferase